LEFQILFGHLQLALELELLAQLERELELQRAFQPPFVLPGRVQELRNFV
jgi:hypothetical protein